MLGLDDVIVTSLICIAARHGGFPGVWNVTSEISDINIGETFGADSRREYVELPTSSRWRVWRMLVAFQCGDYKVNFANCTHSWNEGTMSSMLHCYNFYVAHTDVL